MRIIIWILIISFGTVLNAQDYLKQFGALKTDELTMVVEEFDYLQMQIIGSSGTAYVVELDSIISKTPSVFWKLGEDLMARYGENTVVEIEYRVCYENQCAVRYNVSEEKGNYRKGLVYAEYDTTPPIDYIAINQLAEVFTLRQLLSILDKLNVSETDPIGIQISPCYKQSMFNKADVSCLLNTLLNMPKEGRIKFLNKINN